MGKRPLKINIANYVKRLSNINFIQPLIESIINSLDANATQIKVNFDKIRRTEQTSEGSTTKEFIVGFTIEDNGDGFTEKNIDAFFDMFSGDKAKGKLGSGRFIWLKVFKSIDIESKLPTKTVNIHFCDNYDDITIEEVKTKNQIQETKIVFSGLTAEYKNKTLIYDINEIRNLVENEIFAKLLLLKNDKKQKFEIVFDNAPFSINETSIPSLEQDKFDISVKNRKTPEKFKIFYDIKDDGKGKIENYYAAHGRKVRNFLSDISFRLPDKASSRIIITSKYFDENVNDDRNNFKFDLNNTSDNYPISFAMINDRIEEHVSTILKQKLPKFKDFVQTNIENLIEQHPYIARQIRENAKFGADPKKLLTKSISVYERLVKSSKDRFSRALNKKKLDDKTYNQLIQEFTYLEACELGRYICYRKQIVDCLDKLNKTHEKYEDKLHDLIATKHEDVDKYIDRNLWLLDDKYMNYVASYSDDKILKIKQDIKNNNPTLYGDLKEPDMVLFYNKDIGTKDVVVVEFKGIGATDDDKLYSYSEINRNNVYVARNLTDVNAIYSYIITSLTDNLISDFNTNDNVVLLHTEHKKPIIYWYNRKPKNANGIEIPCHTFVIDTETIVKDADVRNKAFLDLLMSKK